VIKHDDTMDSEVAPVHGHRVASGASWPVWDDTGESVMAWR